MSPPSGTIQVRRSAEPRTPRSPVVAAQGFSPGDPAHLGHARVAVAEAHAASPRAWPVKLGPGGAMLGLLLLIAGPAACSGCAATSEASGSRVEAADTDASSSDPSVAQVDANAPAVAAASPAPREPLPDVAWVTAEIRAVREQTQRRILGPNEPLQPDLPAWRGQAIGLAVDGQAQAPGFFVPVRDPVPERSALEAFHGALDRLKHGGATGAKVRVMFYGASGTASDLWTGYVRRYLQARFGDAGPGIVAPARPVSWYSHAELSVVSSKGWVRAHGGQREKLIDGLYGLMHTAMTATKAGEWSEVRPSKSRRDDLRIAHYELDFVRQPGGGRFSVAIDGQRVDIVDTASDAYSVDTRSYDVEPGAHVLRLETLDDGLPVRLLEVIAESDQPGVVVDTLGIDGVRASVHLAHEELAFARLMARRSPDLIVLSYGTNEAMDEDDPIELYEQRLREVLARLQRAAPTASCLLFGPGDFPRVTGKGKQRRIEPRPRLGEILAVQERVAADVGCGFWDGQAFMGGEGSMQQWVEAQPAYAQRDYLHFNRRGYVRLGMALSDALMLEYDYARR